MKTLQWISQLIIPGFILFVVAYGWVQKVKVYDCFVKGAKDGISVIVRIFPYLLAIFIVVKAFQASGGMNFLQEASHPLLGALGIPLEVISMAVIKPLSGSASIGVFTEIVKTTGPESLATRISAVIMGSAETTFYVLAVYLGAVGIRKTLYLVPVCILADIFGVFTAIAIVKLFF